jgi:hypothetical protein
MAECLKEMGKEDSNLEEEMLNKALKEIKAHNDKSVIDKAVSE